MSFTHVEQDLPPPDDFIGWGDALVYFDCTGYARGGCKGSECFTCEGSRTIVFYLGTFLQNLTIAAFGCATFALGQRASLGVNPDAWRPNAKGRAMPGSEVRR